MTYQLIIHVGYLKINSKMVFITISADLALHYQSNNN